MPCYVEVQYALLYGGPVIQCALLYGGPVIQSALLWWANGTLCPAMCRFSVPCYGGPMVQYALLYGGPMVMCPTDVWWASGIVNTSV